jgi:hypothetical protein
VKGFSHASRRRFIRMMGKIDRSSMPLFVTLTFPDEYYENSNNPVDWKRKLKAFFMRFRRAYPGGAIIYRQEEQARKSGSYIGEFFPHFHLLVFNVDDKLIPWVTLNWWEVCGKLSNDHLAAGTKVERIRSFKGIMYYVSKYMAKPDEGSGLITGRIWGICNISNIPWVKASLVILNEGEAVQLIRYLRRYANLKGRDYRSLTVILDAEFWWRNLDKLLYPR